MAFDSTKLSMISASQYPSIKEAVYTSADTITGGGYFPATCGLKDGDIVRQLEYTKVAGVITAAEFTSYVISDNAGTFTAIATTGY